MSVLNQMLRDLEKRGAMPDVVAAAGMATVARPALVPPAPAANLRRRWIWAGVLAVAAMFVGVHTWLSYRVQDAGVVRQPLGARQFPGLAHPGATSAPSVQVPTPSPAVTPVVSAPATVSESVHAPQSAAPIPAEATRASPARSVPARVAARPPAPRANAAHSNAHAADVSTTDAPAAAANPHVAPAPDSASSPVVVRASNTVAADVDRAADLIARGRATEAMELLAQVLARQPTHAGVRSSLAALLAESGRREQALHVLLAGSEQDPVHFAAPAAQLQAELGDLAGALATLARVPQTRRSARDDALYAGIAQRTGDHMTAIAAYRRALAQPRPDAVWWVGLGVSLEAIGEAEDAAGAYARAAADARLSADVRRYVADRLAVLGAQGARTDEARKASLANVF